MENKNSGEFRFPLMENEEWHDADLGSPSKDTRRSRSSRIPRLSSIWGFISKYSLPLIVVGLLANAGLLADQRRHHTQDATPLRSNDTIPGLQTLSAYFSSIKVPLTQKKFVQAEDGRSFGIKTEYWTQTLGRQVLIMDVDTRVRDKPRQLFYNQSTTWHDLDLPDSACLNHFMYAQIHGYDYQFIQTEDLPDRWGTWVRQPMIRDALKTHRLVVSMDADAVWNHPQVPLEWLLNHWGYGPQHSLAVAGDWAESPDSHGRLGANGGFVVAQRSPRTTEILDAWIDCPTGKQFPNCTRLAYEPWHEQSAFNEFIRYAYNETNDVVELSCDETNGFDFSDFECSGVFVSHYWRWKDMIKRGVTNAVIRPLMVELLANLREHKSEFMVQKPLSSAYDDA